MQSSEELNRKEGGTPSGKKLIVIKEYDITEGIEKSQNSKIISLLNMENLGLENIRKISLCRQTTIADLLKSLSGEVMF